MIRSIDDEHRSIDVSVNTPRRIQLIQSRSGAISTGHLDEKMNERETLVLSMIYQFTSRGIIAEPKSDAVVTAF